MLSKRFRKTSLACVLIALVVTSCIGGCSSNNREKISLLSQTVKTKDGNTFTITLTGYQQDGPVKTKLAKPIGVTVLDKHDKPAKGLRVTFQMIGKEGAKLLNAKDKKSRLQLTTNEHGRAQVFVKLGKKLGVYKVEAIVEDYAGNELYRLVCKLTALNYRELLFGLVGGLGLFLFGMMLMTDALQVIAGSRLKRLLEVLTSRRIFALGVGAIVTALIQSSSATTVMLVGLLNAGLMQLEQAIPIIFGANIGTTITGQLIAFKLSAYALPSIGVAFLLIIAGRTRKQKTYGYALIGFGLLFLGMGTMSGVFKPLRSSPLVAQAFVDFSHNPLLGFLVGLVMTCILQSSSATVGLTIALSGSGLLPFAAAVPIIFGDNVGTTITAVLASLNANLTAKRAACVHVLFNLLGSFIMLGTLWIHNSAGEPVYFALINSITSGNVFAGENVARHVANAHTVFNVFWGFAFLPFSGLFAKLARYLLPAGEGPRRVTLLEEHLLDNPQLAITQSMAEVEEMLVISRRMYVDCFTGIFSRDESYFANLEEQENEVDELQHAVTEYLVKLSQRQIGQESASQLPHVLHSVNDVERVSDMVYGLMRTGESIIEKELKFSAAAQKEMKAMYGKVLEVFERVLLAVATGDKEAAKGARKADGEVDETSRKCRQCHIQRLKESTCEPVAGVAFLDIICDLQKISNLLDNVAQAFVSENNPLPRAH